MDGYDSYDFSADEVFQQGVFAIAEKAEKEGLDVIKEIEKARVYYFKNFVAGSSMSTGENSCDADKVEKSILEEVNLNKEKLSFQELVEFINQGKTIPGIRTIPNRLNAEPPSKPKLSPRRKPWERST